MSARKVLVTGGNGFLGRHVVEELRSRGHDAFAPGHNEYDFLYAGNAASAILKSHADTIVHLAARVGGIGENVTHPGCLFFENAIMGINLMEMAKRWGIDKFVTVGTACSYPEHGNVPLDEDGLWDGYPASATAPYAFAKKMLLVQGQAYRAEYGFNAIYLIPTNLYGPGDSFDLERGHVIPSLVRKFSEATRDGEEKVTLWGTGQATRDFLYVEDAARGIADATERYDGGEPTNLGTGVETSIAHLAEIIADLYDYKGEITWDYSKPDGQPRRCLSTERALERFHWRALMPLEVGLERTVGWYEKNR